MRKINKPDINREDFEYWERVLESHRLGERQLGLQEDLEAADLSHLDNHWKLIELGEREDGDKGHKADA
jgi:hypothetical protein